MKTGLSQNGAQSRHLSAQTSSFPATLHPIVVTQRSPGRWGVPVLPTGPGKAGHSLLGNPGFEPESHLDHSRPWDSHKEAILSWKRGSHTLWLFPSQSQTLVLSSHLSCMGLPAHFSYLLMVRSPHNPTCPSPVWRPQQLGCGPLRGLILPAAVPHQAPTPRACLP